MTTCQVCGVALVNGSSAYIQTRRQIVVKGETVTFTDIEILVCEECA